MPSRKRDLANKLHSIREHERKFTEGRQVTKSYFTPSLVEICAKVVAATFPEQPRIEAVLKGSEPPADPAADAVQPQLATDVNPATGSQLMRMVTSQLATDLPLDVCVARVSSSAYWQARCEAQWPPSQGQLPAYLKYSDKGYSKADAAEKRKAQPDWKRTYLERHLEEFLMSLDDADDADGTYGVPADQRQAELEELSQLSRERVAGMAPLEMLEQLCRLSADKVRRLHLDRQRAHIDWVALFTWLPNLEDFRVTFAVLDAEMHFRFSMFGVRKADIVGRDHHKAAPPRGLVKVLREKPVLTTLSLTENQIGDEETRGLLLGLIVNQSVTSLDLSHNKLSCEGAKALATLLMKNGSVIETLNLADNLIGVGGGKALGRALQTNATLRTLTLRLNRLSDGGGAQVALGLRDNKSLTSLNLSHNELAGQSSEALGQALKVNDKLTHLDLAGNMLADEGGALLLEAVKASSSLLEVDVRCSGVSDSDAEELKSVLKQRSDARKRAAEMEQEEQLQALTDAAVKDWKERFYMRE